MAGNGPLPKAERQRPRDTARRDRDVVTVTPDDVVRGPELPDGHPYSPTTVSWYETWRRSPQAQVFEETDWLALGLVLPLVEAHSRRPSAAAAAEIRLTTAALGGTYADRLRVAKIRVERPTADSSDTAVGSNVTPIHARRASVRDRLAPDPEPERPAATASDPAPF